VRQEFKVIAALALLLITQGCAKRMGSRMIRGDRFDYSAAISDSQKTQMMLNLVRVRYLDEPMFMDVAQVVTQYTLEGSAAVSTPDWPGGVFYPGAAASGRWAESPTITYNPMSGEKFTRSLLAPVSPVTVFQLIQSGWPIDGVLAFSVRSINGIHAASNIQMMKRQPDPAYHKLLSLLRELQLSDAISVRVLTPVTGGKVIEHEPVVEFGSHNANSELLAKTREAKRMLGLKEDEASFRISYGAVQTNDREIALLTRSFLEVIGEAAAGVEIPESDLNDGRAVQVTIPETATSMSPLSLVRIHSSKSKPGPNDAFISAQYHGHWFYIDDRDLTSKRGLRFLLILSTLAESGSSMSPPALTISKP
jgi:hypothetical protein